MIRIKETSAVEFTGDNEDNLKVFLNGRKYTIYDFIERCKYDQECATVLLAIKKKMKTERYPNDNIIDFIIDHFGYYNQKFDVLIKNGTIELNNRGKDCFAVFDDEEIQQGYKLGKRRKTAGHTGEKDKMKRIREAVKEISPRTKEVMDAGLKNFVADYFLAKSINNGNLAMLLRNEIDKIILNSSISSEDVYDYFGNYSVEPEKTIQNIKRTMI